MDYGILLHAFLNHAPSSQALVLAYQNARDSSPGSDSTDMPAFGALANTCQQPSNFAYIIMTGRPWPSGDSPLLPQWTPINGPRVDRTGAEIRALSYVHDSEENAEAVVAPLAVWNDRQHTPESRLLRDAARGRPADSIITSDTSYTKSTAEMRPPPTLTDDEIFAGGLALLDTSSYTLQIAGTHRNQEIVEKLNAGYTEPIISRTQVDYRIAKALDIQSRLEKRPKAEIKAKLKEARKKSGVLQRWRSDIGKRGQATRAAKKKQKEDAEFPPETFEMYESSKTAPLASGRTQPTILKETASIDNGNDQLADLEEMGRRVMGGSLSSVVNSSENNVLAAEQQFPKQTQQKSGAEGSSGAKKRKAYDYDRDGDTTDEETRAEQISRFQRRKVEARRAASEAQVRRILKRL